MCRRSVKLIGVVIFLSVLGFQAIKPRAHFSAPFFSGCKKVWSHRTLGTGASENSLAGAARAFELGATGIEIDIIYDQDKQRFFVISEEASEAGASLNLTLDEMLDSLPPDVYVWLDYWNLKLLPGDAARHAAHQLWRMLEHRRLFDRVIIESVDEDKLAELAEVGMSTSLWLSVRPKDRLIAHLHDILRSIAQYHEGSYAAVSLDYTSYSKYVAAVFKAVPIHLFTVNDRATVERLVSDSRIKVILTDKPYFRVTGCRAAQESQ